MKKKLLYCLTALLAIGATSCKDDDEIMGAVNPSTDFNRMPMTQFRQLETTNKDENADPYCSRVITEEINTIELQWYGIEGAGGYEIKFGPNADLASKPENWDNESILTGHYFVGPDVCSMRLPDLSYDVTYLFAIRVLHPEDVRVDASTGEITGVVENDRHSKWYGLGSQREWARFLRLTTGSRYAFPRAINVGNISADRDAFTVYIDASVKTAVASYRSWNFASEQEMFEDLREHFDFIEDGTENDWQTATFKFDRLQIESTTGTIDPQFKDMPIDMTELVTIDENGQPVIGKGEIRVTGLSMNSIYVVNLVNTTRDVAYVDQLANTVRKPVWGDPEKPILIRHQSPATDSLPGQVEFDAMCIDNILSSFTDENNTDLPEGTTFYLQGDKAYVVSQNITVPKGFILETDPDDVANGKRAKLYMGGIGAPLNEDGSLGTGIGTSNFMFGRRSVGAPAPLEVGDLVFRNLDIDAPLATNYGTAISNGSGNYFINMFSDGEEVSFKKIEIDNCYFRRMVRGFIRVQGNKPKIFEQMIVSNCIFSDCGFYDQNGRGYAWFAGDGAQGTSNIFTDFRFINNTIYDSPRTAFVTDNDRSLSYVNGGWHITIENNTFINFSTMTTGRNFFQTRYIPGGSHYSFKRNLIVLAADENDNRNLYQYGADLRECDGEFSFDISDNYSVGCRDAHMNDDGIFTSSQSFMRTNNSFGTVDRWNPGLVDESGAATDDKNRMVVKVLTDDNGNKMKATDLFNNPNPPYLSDPSAPKATDHAGPADIYTALRYKTVPSIITEKNIGDPRWR